MAQQLVYLVCFIWSLQVLLHVVTSDSPDIDPSLLRLSEEVFRKSILNEGQLSPRVINKMRNNECLDMLVYGTSITCAETNDFVAENRPHGFEDGWTFQLFEYMKVHFPPCFRNSVPSNHTFLQVRCYGPDNLFDPTAVNFTEVVKETFNTQVNWLESVQIFRRQDSNKLLQADIIFVEALQSPHPDSAKDTERFMYSLKSLRSEPSVIYVGASFVYRGDNTSIWQRASTDTRFPSRHSDSVFTQSLVAKYYEVPFVSFIDAFGPFTTEDSKSWLLNVFLTDKVCHISRIGHKIVARLVANYLSLAIVKAKSSLKEGIADNYTDVSTLVPLYTPKEDLVALISETHPPLTIPLNCFSMFHYLMWMIGHAPDWTPDGESPSRVARKYQQKWGIGSDVVDGSPFILVIPHDSLHLHFFHQKLRILVGKNVRGMGTLQIQVRVFGRQDALVTTNVDCLLHSQATTTTTTTTKRKLSVSESTHRGHNFIPIHSRERKRNLDVVASQAPSMSAADKAEEAEEISMFESFKWFDIDIHISKQLRDTDSLEISFRVIASLPSRVNNTVKLGGVHLS